MRTSKKEVKLFKIEDTNEASIKATRIKEIGLARQKG